MPRRPRILFERLHKKAVWPTLCPLTSASFTLCGLTHVSRNCTHQTIKTGIGITLPRGWVGTVQTDPFAIERRLIVTSYPITHETTSIHLSVQNLDPKTPSLEYPSVVIRAGLPLAIVTFVRSGTPIVSLVDSPSDKLS